MIGRRRRPLNVDTEVGFAEPPWDHTTAAWREIDSRIPENHLAREVDASVDRLDLGELVASYEGRGTPPLRPDLMLRLVMYERECGKPSPADWFRDTRENDAVKWLTFGLQPSRAACYEFRDRIAPFLESCNEQVLGEAVAAGLTAAARGALDGSALAACASRHTLVRDKTLQRRQGELDEAIAGDERGEPPATTPRWMARFPETRLQQHDRYQRARERMDELQQQNRRRRASKRQDPEKIVVSTSDPDAGLGRDKLHVFRPLYNAVLLEDLDSPFVLGYEVFNRAGDSGTLEPLLERTTLLTGRKPEVVLADSTFAAVSDLLVCETHAITLYAPPGENDYSEKNQRRPGTNQFTALPKTEFAWLEDQQTYRCPEGHVLQFERCQRVPRANGQSVGSRLFRCRPEHCRTCPRRDACTPNPDKGRSVSRLDNEELLEALRERMQTDDAKALYRLRAAHIELRFADLKEHRKLRRLNSRTLPRARAEVATAVLTHNLLTLHRMQSKRDDATKTTRTLDKIAA